MARRILVPYDGSLHAHCAAVEAATRAAQSGAAVTLLTVVPEPAPFIVLDGELRAEARYEMQRRFEALLLMARNEFPPEVDVDVVVATGDPAERILDAIEEGDFELVVMGARSRGQFHSMSEGGVAREVRRLSPVPVVLTPAVPWRDRREQHQQRMPRRFPRRSVSPARAARV